jgi:hypothetical protein
VVCLGSQNSNKGLRPARTATMGGGGSGIICFVFLDLYCLDGKCLLLHLLEAEARTGGFFCVL